MAHKWMAVAVLAAAVMPLTAGDGKGKNKHRHEYRGAPRTNVAVQIFVGDDRRVMHDYFTGYRGGGLPPGLAKRHGALPPGLEKHLRKNGRLPPGLEKKLYPFPVELESRLCPLQPGLRRAFIDGRAVIYNPRTSVILDVFIPL